MLRFLLDTNIVVHVIKRRPLSALALFSEHSGHMAISSITLVESVAPKIRPRCASIHPAIGFHCPNGV